MTIHTTLLNQLESFEERFGVKVVPVDGAGYRLRCVQGVRFYWGIGEDYCQLKDAHAHIREGARKAVEWWCRSKRDNRSDSGCFTEDYGDEVIVSWVRIDSESHAHERTLGYGPTTEDALSGALSHILKEKAE